MWNAPRADLTAQTTSASSSLPTWKQSRSLLADDIEVVEARRCVGLGPETDPARLLEGAVLEVEHRLVIEGHLAALAPHADAQRVPLIRICLQLCRLEHRTPAGNDLVDA